MVDIGSVNNKIVGGIANTFRNSKFLNSIGWILMGILAIGATGFWAWWYLEKKKYNKNITAFEIVGDYYYPYTKDTAKVVKIGKGGFEVLYLRKMKTWKLAYGAKINQNTYYFFVDKIGYWYPGMIAAGVNFIDRKEGLLPVVTTNPTMRSQYTSLEKQINDLHGQKESFWNKYGVWVLAIGYLVIIGVFSWLSYREIGGFLGSGAALADKMNALADSMNRLAINLNNANPSGLVPAR